MLFHGVELNVNLLNASFAERYEAALQKLQDDIKNVNTESLAQSIRGQIACVKSFIDTAFGAGVYVSLKMDGDDLDQHLDLVEQIVMETAAQKERIRQRFDKYSPNRAARRANPASGAQ